MKPDFKDASLFMKPDFNVKNWEREMVERDFAKRNQDSFSVSEGLPKNGKWRTKIPSGGLLKNGKWRTKVPSGGLPKNGKWRTKVRKSWVSRVSSEKWKKPKFVLDLGWISEEQKKKTNLNGLVYFGNQFLSSI
ncbi:unnamed protein product [Rhizophagus irregularis]|nr:unnamed protein product [Rhizophagus irregularis]